MTISDTITLLDQLIWASTDPQQTRRYLIEQWAYRQCLGDEQAGSTATLTNEEMRWFVEAYKTAQLQQEIEGKK